MTTAKISLLTGLLLAGAASAQPMVMVAAPFRPPQVVPPSSTAAAAEQPPLQPGPPPQPLPEAAKSMDGMAMTTMPMGSGGAPGAQSMMGALAGEPMSREASGTSWQPEDTPQSAVEMSFGAWMIMLHGDVNGVADWQQGLRGGQAAFPSGMVMGMAERPLGNADTLQLRLMLSPEPLMGPAGYPLLLATGETANGRTPLIDRQHPHNFVSELAATYSHRLSAGEGVFLYVGLPGEPAFGPPAFMHRLSIMDSPEAPISHHWLDSTHVSEGVVTTGYVSAGWKIEVSRYNAREPDQNRWAIEPNALDSSAARISWNPTAALSLQGSWAFERSPEQLQPQIDQRKWSLSALYTVPVGQAGWWSSTIAWGQRSSPSGDLSAFVLETAVKPSASWTLFARAERVDNNELAEDGPLVGTVFTVSKASLGLIHDWRLNAGLSFGVGGLYAWNFVPSPLALLYGKTDPQGAMAFVRLKIG